LQSNKLHRVDIDTIRCVACILVVLYHCIGINELSGLHLKDEHPLHKLNEWLAYIRMPIFAFLAGVVYSLRPFDGEWKQFVKGKFKRLLIPMLTFGTLLAILKAYYDGTLASTSWVTLHILPVDHLWFLEAMFIVFLAIAVLESVAWLRTEAGLLVAICVAAAMSVLRLHFTSNYFGLSGAFYLFPYVLLGVWYCRFGVHYRLSIYLALCAATLLAAFQLGIQHGTYADRFSFGAMLMSGVMCLLLMRSGLRSERLASVGRYSFAIYLFHPLFTAGARNLALAVVPSIPVWILAVTGTLCAIAGSILAARLLRKWRWGRVMMGEFREPDPKLESVRQPT
jgi:fucose 4-O-acetylase-like acetyltransferase